jgi:cytochrome P450
MTPTETAPDFLTALLTPEFHTDPYPFYAALRDAAPVQQTPFGVWLLTRHADAVAVTRDPRLSNDESNSDLQAARRAAGNDPLSDQMNQTVLLFMDPPDHTRLRGLVSKAFTPKTVQQLRRRVQALVDGFLDDVDARGDGRMDVIADLAYPLPVVIICELMGVPPADHETFQGWSRELAAGIDPSPLRTPEQEVRIAAAAAEFIEYFAALIEGRRAALGDDLLSGLIAAEEGGDRLTIEELLSTAMFLLVAGHETTVNLIGNGTLALLRHPDERRRLAEDPDLDRAAIEELLRYDSPVQLTQRIPVEDYEVGGVRIPKGQNIVPLLGATNRDPAVFADPDRLDLGRENANRHLAFGGGHHFCLGAALARLEGEIAIGTLVRRYPALELAGEPVRRQTFTLRGLDQLPVSV